MTTKDPGEETRRALTQLVALIGPQLTGSTILRADLETALLSLGGGSLLRAEALKALAAARITVVGDTPAAEAPAHDAPGSADSAPAPAIDPVDAARRRIALDRRVPPDRRNRIILTADEEVGLALLYRPEGEDLPKGGFAQLRGEARDAAEAMVLHNTRLAHSIAQKYAGQGLEHDDLVQHALQGLIRAVELFDPGEGCKFSTYATWWLRQAVTRALANESRVIRIPVHMWEVVRKVMATRERMTQEGRPPSLRDLATECQLPVDKVIECLRLAPGVLSLETPLGEDGFTLGDLVDAQADSHEHIEVHGLFPEDVERLLSLLDMRSADVLRRRNGLAPHDRSWTLDEIGKVHSVTRERIRQIEAKALATLGTHLAREGDLSDVSHGEGTCETEAMSA